MEKNKTKLEFIRIWEIIAIILILGRVDNRLITLQEEPSYISGIQKCNGNKLILKQKDKDNNTILTETT